MNLTTAIKHIEHGHDLTIEETQAVFDIIFSGEPAEADIATFLLALRNKGETVAELRGAAASMRASMKPLLSREGALDIVGTGGDGHGTLNISTAAAIVAAGAGVPVAKHGNKSATSLSGSSDVLTALGINLEPDWHLLQNALDEVGLVFLFAPRHHPSMRHVTNVRKKLGVRTIFNLLGPLTNPARVRHHVIGVFDYAWARPMAETLKASGSASAWVTHGQDGLDEITTTGETLVCELKDGMIHEFTVTPEEVGLPRASLDQLKGGDPLRNAQALRDLLSGQRGPYRDIVVMNAGAGLYVAGATNCYKSSVHLAEKAIDSGDAQRKLDDMIQMTNALETP